MVAILARYASRFSVRALDLTVDFSLLWVGVLLALVAAVLLAYVPRLPTADASHGTSLSNGGLRITGATRRKLHAFAIIQIAASFVLLAGAGMLLKTLLALQAAESGFDTHNVLALDVPVMAQGRTPERIIDFYKEAMRRISELPGVERVAVGTDRPVARRSQLRSGLPVLGGRACAGVGRGGSTRAVQDDFTRVFAALGVPILAGRDFDESDRRGGESVVIVSQSVAQRMFPNQDAVNHHLTWTDPIMKFIDVSSVSRRIVGVAADIDDENVVPGPALSVYHPFEQEIGGGRLFVHARTDPYALVTPITRIIRNLSADQPVERAATLEDVKAEVLAPDRLNTLVFGGFAAVALAVAVVGVAGVLAFSVSGRTREFGIRLAVGSQPRHILAGVLE